MVDKEDDEMFLVSSDTETEFGDQNNLFYDDKATTAREIKLALSTFDRDNGGLSNVYQEKFLPKLNDRSHKFMKWLINKDLLCSTVICPNAKNDPMCLEYMEFVIAVEINDLYQLRCKNCSRKESVRKYSIFYGLKCNLRSVIRILYGWVKGVDLDLMANLLGLDKQLIGTVYNRAAKLAFSCMSLCPELSGDFGGERVVVLIDIYPHMMENTRSLKKACKPILCISEVESLPQKYWLEPLNYWDNNNEEQVEEVRKRITHVIFTLVKRGSVLILPSKLTIAFEDVNATFGDSYFLVKTLDDLYLRSTEERPLPAILDVIWQKPMAICEEAQYFNPDYVNQYLIKRMWNDVTDKNGFIMLISFIVYETRRRKIDTYFEQTSLGGEEGQ